MALIVPVLLIGTGAVTAVGGAANAIRGAQKMRRAHREAAAATARYEAEVVVTQQATAATSTALRTYGEHQERALEVVTRMIEFMRRNHQAVSERASELLAGVTVETQEVDGFNGRRITAEGVAVHLVTTAVATATTYSAVPMAVAAYGTASTGAAISGLSGAAAQNAIMAWLGGGSIAAGGGGMALGAIALNAVAIGPALLVGGFVMNGKGETALTEATRYCTEIDASVREQERLRTRLSLVDERVQELDEVLANVRRRGTEALNLLESSEPFDADAHAGEFRQALAFAIAIRDIIAVPVLDANGELDPDTERVLVLYRGMA